jgi:hypothetical protein
MLADHFRADGKRPDGHPKKKYKFDHYHCLYFCLKQLNNGNFYKTREADTGWGKPSLQEDTVHVLCDIVEGLDDEFQWLYAARRPELANVFPGMFHGCVGVSDKKEYQFVKYLDTILLIII